MIRQIRYAHEVFLNTQQTIGAGIYDTHGTDVLLIPFLKCAGDGDTYGSESKAMDG